MEKTKNVELKLTLLANGQILCETEGEQAEIAVMLCRTMVAYSNIASIVCGAIPTFLDEKNIDRAGFCEQIMNAVGNKKR